MRPLAIFHLVAGGALLALAIQTLLNVRHLPRLERMPPPSRFRRVAMLLPARNEAARLGETVRACTRQSYPDAGILVYDDASADGIGALAAAAGGDRVRGCSAVARYPPGGAARRTRATSSASTPTPRSSSSPPP